MRNSISWAAAFQLGSGYRSAGRPFFNIWYACHMTPFEPLWTVYSFVKSKWLLGSVIGTKSFREQYIENKVEDWVKDLQLLSNYAQDDPQAAYSALTIGLWSWWTHFQTVPDMSELFVPLENVIIEQLIHTLTGQEVSDAEGQMLALPLRHGGLGLTNPQETAKTEYDHATHITAKLTKSTLKHLILITTSQTNNIPGTQRTEYDKRRTQNAEIAVMNFCIRRTDSWVTTTHKRSNGKRGIFLAVSLSNQSD